MSLKDKLSNIDFSGDNAKKIIGIILSVGILLIAIVIGSSVLGGDDGKKDSGPLPAQLENIPKGQNNDDNDGKSSYEIRKESSRGARLSDIYSDLDTNSVSSDDPMGDSFSGKTKKDKPVNSLLAESERKTHIREQEQAQSSTTAPTTRPSYSGRKTYPDVSSEETPQERLNRARRQKLIENGYNPDTGLPLVDSPLASSTQPEEAPAQETVPETPKEPRPEVVVLSDEQVSNGIGNNLGKKMFGEGESSKNRLLAHFDSDAVVGSGQRVVIRTNVEMLVNGERFPVNTVIYATAQISGDRLKLSVKNIVKEGRKIPFNYKAIDINDMEDGIYCPETISDKRRKTAVQEGKQIGRTVLQEIVSGAYGQRVVSSGQNVVSAGESYSEVQVTKGFQFELVPNYDD